MVLYYTNKIEIIKKRYKIKTDMTDTSDSKNIQHKQCCCDRLNDTRSQESISDQGPYFQFVWNVVLGDGETPTAIVQIASTISEAREKVWVNFIYPQLNAPVSTNANKFKASSFDRASQLEAIKKTNKEAKCLTMIEFPYQRGATIDKTDFNWLKGAPEIYPLQSTIVASALDG